MRTMLSRRMPSGAAVASRYTSREWLAAPFDLEAAVAWAVVGSEADVVTFFRASVRCQVPTRRVGAWRHAANARVAPDEPPAV